MGIDTTVVGSYPKPPDEGRPFVLRRKLHAAERGDATEADVRKAEDDLVREVIREQEDAGVAFVTDGHVRWDDLLTPFARHMAGFELGGLLRWFDNNVYYRRPVCVGPVEWRGPASVGAYRFAASVAKRPVKAVVPGPVTFARLSVDDHYGDHERFVLAIARVLAQECFELEAAGARHVQIDEPALLEAPEDLSLAARAIALLKEELRAVETTLATYFGDAKRLGSSLFQVPVDRFGFDLVAGPENRELIRSAPPGTKIQAGVVDARNTRLETPDDLKRSLAELVASVGGEHLRVSPSAGLEYLPRENARAKLQRLCDIARKVGD
jgi:5-methyltetrahydropteroyltriglutamate--homocysteine methyltransferase